MKRNSDRFRIINIRSVTAHDTNIALSESKENRKVFRSSYKAQNYCDILFFPPTVRSDRRCGVVFNKQNSRKRTKQQSMNHERSFNMCAYAGCQSKWRWVGHERIICKKITNLGWKMSTILLSDGKISTKKFNDNSTNYIQIPNKVLTCVQLGPRYTYWNTWKSNTKKAVSRIVNQRNRF